MVSRSCYWRRPCWCTSPPWKGGRYRRGCRKAYRKARARAHRRRFPKRVYGRRFPNFGGFDFRGRLRLCRRPNFAPITNRGKLRRYSPPPGFRDWRRWFANRAKIGKCSRRDWKSGRRFWRRTYWIRHLLLGNPKTATFAKTSDRAEPGRADKRQKTRKKTERYGTAVPQFELGGRSDPDSGHPRIEIYDQFYLSEKLYLGWICPVLSGWFTVVIRKLLSYWFVVLSVFKKKFSISFKFLVFTFSKIILFVVIKIPFFCWKFHFFDANFIFLLKISFFWCKFHFLIKILYFDNNLIFVDKKFIVWWKINFLIKISVFVW